MRGNVYRFGRRRAGSFVLATGAAVVLALGWTSAAAAKPAIRALNIQMKVQVQARPLVFAHAAGHKIA